MDNTALIRFSLHKGSAALKKMIPEIDNLRNHLFVLIGFPIRINRMSRRSGFLPLGHVYLCPYSEFNETVFCISFITSEPMRPIRQIAMPLSE